MNIRNTLVSPLAIALVVSLTACKPHPDASPDTNANTPAAAKADSPQMQDAAQAASTGIPVTVENFVRAESDMYFNGLSAAHGGFGKLFFDREPAPVDKQTVIRLNRDTLYGAGVFDLDAGPVTITLPDPGKHFMSLQTISEDHYTWPAAYSKGTYTVTKQQVGTRYVTLGIRILPTSNDAAGLDEVHKLQDAITFSQPGGPGKLELPQWDQASQKKIRDALLVLAASVTDTSRAFGRADQVDPIQHLIGTASAWGANPPSDATYLNVVPPRNDGKTTYRLTVDKVPVDGFWSISVYNADGYFQPNAQNAYSVNNITAKKGPDGSITVQFGDCTANADNCLPTVPGWNYMIRLYRPRAEILTGTWKFPEAQAVN